MIARTSKSIVLAPARATLLQASRIPPAATGNQALTTSPAAIARQALANLAANAHPARTLAATHRRAHTLSLVAREANLFPMSPSMRTERMRAILTA
jgi:hypothetical protein